MSALAGIKHSAQSEVDALQATEKYFSRCIPQISCGIIKRSAMSDEGIGEQDNEGSGADSVLLFLIGWIWWFALRPVPSFRTADALFCKRPARCEGTDQCGYEYNCDGPVRP